jgi:hypothetical protein
VFYLQSVMHAVTLWANYTGEPFVISLRQNGTLSKGGEKDKLTSNGHSAHFRAYSALFIHFGSCHRLDTWTEHIPFSRSASKLESTLSDRLLLKASFCPQARAIVIFLILIDAVATVGIGQLCLRWSCSDKWSSSPSSRRRSGRQMLTLSQAYNSEL